MRHILIPIESHFLPPYRVEYDGKYISLYGKNKNYPLGVFGCHVSDESEIFDYDETLLIPIVLEIRGANPEILNFGTKNIYLLY